MPVISNNKNTAISDIVYQNKDVLDIFSGKTVPSLFSWIQTFSPVDIFPPLKNDAQGKYLDATY